MTNKLTIYDIKRLSKETAPYFFSRNTLKFFNQTLKSFSVYKIDDKNFKIVAPMKDRNNKLMGYTKRIFNLDTNTLNFIENENEVLNNE